MIDEVSPTVWATVAVVAVGGFFTVINLLITSRAKHSADKMIVASKAADALAKEAALEAEHDREEKRDAAMEARQVAKENREYARLDEVAARAEAAALATISKLNKLDETTTLTHSMVNSDKTADMGDRLIDKLALLAMMRELINLKRANGHEPTSEAVAAVEALELSIETLRTNIADRMANQAATEQSLASDEGDNGLGVVEKLEARVETLETPPLATDPP
jgi:hypothetical protein